MFSENARIIYHWFMRNSCWSIRFDVSVSHFSLNKTYPLVNGLVSALEVGTMLKQVF